jgi:glycosyltransferase involved in cell wall biosynthesis
MTAGRLLPVRILTFGTYDTTSHPRVGIILDGFRAHGDEVVAANAPLGFSTAQRVEFMRRPWTVYRFAGRILARWWQIGWRARTLRRDGRPDATIVGYLGHFDVLLARLLFPRDTILLDLLVFAADTARDRGFGRRRLLGLLGALDRLAIACATIVAVDTQEHLDLLPPRQRKKGIVVPVGASAEWFAAGPESPPMNAGPVRVVFFGLFTPLQGAPVIGEALGALAGVDRIQTTMIGTGQDLAASRRAAGDNLNVTWLDWVDHDKLPDLVAGHDVCLGIFGTSAKARRVVPNKVYQGAAAGCAVVTSDTDPQRRTLADAALFVPPGDGRALAEALHSLARDRDRLVELRRAAKAVSRGYGPYEIVVGLRARLSTDARTYGDIGAS